MSYVRSLVLFLYDFVVGEDVLLFLVVVAAVLTTALIAGSVNAWWLLPVLVATGLTGSVWRAARRDR
jgi:hypothetical protein